MVIIMNKVTVIVHRITPTDGSFMTLHIISSLPLKCVAKYLNPFDKVIRISIRNIIGVNMQLQYL